MVGLVALQIGLVVRAYAAPHREFGYQMFPEASRWRADIVRVTDDGRRVSIREPWFGYEWSDLVRGRGLTTPWVEHHADSGLDRQLQFLAEALDWVAANTPADRETLYLEAIVESSFNTEPTRTEIIRSRDRPRP
ncbi:hypothetical protein [Ilumatobacter sp.]|uniref:hypothetical protein n=1 Tax=Ilumatobacter sp. TaxID=1967498 RepID=UPI003AF60322